MAAPNLKEIEWAISELESEETSKAGYILLAALYTCRNEMMGDPSRQAQISTYSEAAPLAEPLGQYGESEFLQVVAGKDPASAWRVINELMDTLRTFNPKVYNGVMRKLNML